MMYSRSAPHERGLLKKVSNGFWSEMDNVRLRAISVSVHWWTDEPRNEARYEGILVYEARNYMVTIRGS